MSEFPEICGQCRQEWTWTGKGKARAKVCGCPVVPVVKARRKCSHKGAKAKGDGEERAICRAAEGWGWTAYRTAGSGAHGSRNNEQAFATDVRMKCADMVLRIESKRHASVAGLKSLRKLQDNSDILWVREDFGEPFVFMSADVFGQLVTLAAEALKK